MNPWLDSKQWEGLLPQVREFWREQEALWLCQEDSPRWSFRKLLEQLDERAKESR